MLTISNKKIGTTEDGLYCLNDFHRASGGQKKHAPYRFMRNAETRKLVKAVERTPNMVNGNSAKAYKIIKGGNAKSKQGTYVCKELVYRYAMWISPEFTLLVIRTFDEVANQQQKLSVRLEQLLKDLDAVTISLSNAGRFLCIGGKKIKPQLQQYIDSTLKQMQPSLELVGGTDSEK